MSLPFTPLSSAVMTADLLPDAFAKVDIPGGELTASVFDPIGGGSNPLVQANADVVRFMFENTKTQTFNIPNDVIGMAMTGMHSIGGSPVNTGSGTGLKTAKISYTGIFQWRNLTAGTLIGTSIVQSNMISTWAEDGQFIGTVFETPSLIGSSAVLDFTATDYLATVTTPGFAWAPGVVMMMKAQLAIIATADDPGLSAMLDATNTGKLLLTFPEGITPYDAGLITRADLPWITPAVVPVPSAVWLFGSGLGLLGWMKRRKTRQVLH